jgi:hypothetical protein
MDATRLCTPNFASKTSFSLMEAGMKNTQVKTQIVATRVQGFLDAHADVVAGVVRPEIRAQLDQLATQLADYALEQGTTTSAALTATATQPQLRRQFYELFIKPIRIITKRVVGRVPEYDAMVLKLAVTKEPTFVTTANVLADAAQKYEPVLVANGLPSDFVAQMRALIGQLTTTTATRDRHVGRRVGSTAALTAADRAFRELLAQLDSLLVPLLAKNPAVLADWKASSRIPQLPVTPLPTGGVVLPTSPEPVSAAQPAVTEVHAA